MTSLGGLYLERLIHEGAYFRNFTVFFIGLSGSVFAFFVVSCRL